MKAFILTGSREWTEDHAIRRTLMPLVREDALMINGGARGADRVGLELWRGRHAPCVAMPAQWERDGKAAGPIRNEAMLRVLLALRDCGYEVSVEAFSLPQSVGTAHMKRIAEAAGVTVNEHGRAQ